MTNATYEGSPVQGQQQSIERWPMTNERKSEGNDQRPESGEQFPLEGWHQGRFTYGAPRPGAQVHSHELRRLGLLAQTAIMEEHHVEWLHLVSGRQVRDESHAQGSPRSLCERMGEDQFAEAVSEVERAWQPLIAAALSELRSCGNYDGRPHDHNICLEALEWADFTVDSCIARWPELSRQQARMILEGMPFIGMTVEQASVLLSVFEPLSNDGCGDASEVRYLACFRECHGGDPTPLMFRNCRLVRIEHTDGRDFCGDCVPSQASA